MLIDYKVKGFKAFDEEVKLSYKANKKIRNKDYVFKINEEEILKSAIIYGPNNTGKSCFIESLEELKAMIIAGQISQNLDFFSYYNMFDEKEEISYQIEFFNEELFKYELNIKYSIGITKERLFINNELLFDRFETNNNKELNDVLELFNLYSNRLIVSTLPKDYVKYTKKIRDFFDNLVIIPKNIIFEDIVKEISELSNKELNKFTNILKSADISINRVFIDENFDTSSKNLKLFSEYVMQNKKVSIPSIIGDSEGTHVFMLYMLKIIKLLKTGGVLVVDEIDKSLHTAITKNIVSLFNDANNKNIQLLATSHDLQLLDCIYLFRKDQVWFTYKDENQVYLYSLDTFKSNKDNQIRNKTLESYLQGMFGALPHPNIEDYIFDE